MPDGFLDKTVEKIDWKQWVPVWGVGQILYDEHCNHPTVAENSSLFYTSAVYHGSSLVGLFSLWDCLL